MQDRVKTIRLYGVLGAKFGRVHRFVVRSPRDALRVLCIMVPGFERFMADAHQKNLTFSIFIGGDNINKDQLDYPSGRDDIRIAPIIQGSKQGGLFQTILGVALMVASIWLGPGAFFAGLSMTMGGVAALLAPQTKGLSSGDKPENQASYAFNGPVNTQAQGGAVPCLWGELIVGSAVISAGIYAEDRL